MTTQGKNFLMFPNDNGQNGPRDPQNYREWRKKKMELRNEKIKLIKP